ncbi:MAG: histidinol dehydrogenase [Polyangiaceae bacterium]
MPILRILSEKSPESLVEVRALRDKLRSGKLTAASEQSNLDVPAIVRDLLSQVERGGDAVVAQLTSKLDRANITPESLRVPVEELKQAHAEADPDFLELIRTVIANIREYQEHIRIRAPEPLLRGGRVLGVRYTPIDRVGVYVPGGRALYPSTVLMTVVPAQVAGVREIVMVSPPTGGDISPMAKALAAELGITEVYRMGGAVALGALAYGTESIHSVQKIVGPGNAFVAEAKRQLFGRVGIDSIAGPSEVFIVADDAASPVHVASDLLAQAEHDPGSAILATPSQKLAEAVAGEVERQVAALERRDAIVAALASYSACVVTSDLNQACELANEFATEHLQIITHNDARCLQLIRHAGAIFLGSNTPVPVGDYYAGPSHVLPTGGTARQFGPLSCNDFLKASSLLHYDVQSIDEDGRGIIDFATREGLTAHAAAVRARLER